MWPRTLLGKRAQQPHRIDRVGKLAPERRQRVVRLRQQREVVVLAVVVPAAGADVDAGAIAVLRRRFGREGVAIARRARPRRSRAPRRRARRDRCGGSACGASGPRPSRAD